ncbi:MULTISPECIES: lipopolysaccharide assembly protein LapA domain-containing protein [unclassified Bradyrhizobium]|uniref:lipopolysaccharide assembly protein LapA domain-containing protein n=1 Tax=unclassified Bradyrhizobium TaxID=2631580 RepID=UPI0028E2CFFD|nr:MULTISPECIES: lipopolysaccharide assembly protein LapA domain-containing protein [unclassified Bradyrhizobium]
MRKFFTVVVVLPLLVLFVIFAVANRHFVTVSFDPFNATDPALAASVPLFALIIAVAILGVIAGGCATWIGQRRWRRAARRHQADAEAARAQVAQLSAAARAKQGSAQSLVPAAPARLFAPYGRDKQGAAL